MLTYKDDSEHLVEAIGYTGDNLLEVLHFVGVSGFLMDFEDDETLYMNILGQEIKVQKTEYIIRGYDHLLSVCNARVFNATYTYYGNSEN